ncbi:MAG: NUDIX hydrolase [Chloroflexi bacterium]|nr:NUDIX hydrolase [Chloroflexota bacterium]
MPFFRVHVDALIRRGSEILILQHATGARRGAWAWPGGSLEEDESPEEAVRREVREETGLELSSVRILRATRYRSRSGSSPAVGITYVCELPPDAEARLSEEHTAARWIDAAEFRSRYLGDEVLTAVSDDPDTLTQIEGMRGVLDAYLVEYAG